MKEWPLFLILLDILINLNLRVLGLTLETM